MYKFDSQVVITVGVKEKIDPYIIDAMLNAIKEAEKRVERDYLQIFKLTNLKGHTQVIEHWQEVPQYKTILYLVDIPQDKIIDEKIYIIDDVDHITILLADEY